MSLQDTDEQTLLARVGQRDEQALGILYERYSSSVFNLASYVLRNREMAEEITQDVFVLIWRKPEQWNASLGLFSSWILSVTRHIAIDRLRSELRQVNSSSGVPIDEVADQLEAVTGASVQLDDIQYLSELLGELPVEQKQVLFLAFFQTLTHDEIAARMQVPVGTVKSRLRLALSKLRAKWTEESPHNHTR